MSFGGRYAGGPDRARQVAQRDEPSLAGLSARPQALPLLGREPDLHGAGDQRPLPRVAGRREAALPLQIGQPGPLRPAGLHPLPPRPHAHGAALRRGRPQDDGRGLPRDRRRGQSGELPSRPFLGFPGWAARLPDGRKLRRSGSRAEQQRWKRPRRRQAGPRHQHAPLARREASRRRGPGHPEQERRHLAGGPGAGREDPLYLQFVFRRLSRLVSGREPGGLLVEPEGPLRHLRQERHGGGERRASASLRRR